jgi:Fe-S-cluster containining protein
MKNRAAIITAIEAYKGEIGRLREEFCIDFIKQKSKSYNRIQDEIFRQIDSRDEKVTCHKGCSACCVLYIEACIQEAEAIVYFLYRRPDLLTGFLDRYDYWRDRMRQLGNPFSRCEQILHNQREDMTTGSDRQTLLDTLRLYHSQNIPCPFLNSGICSIYEVRPYVCANHYVTTPSEWCQAVNWCNPEYPDRPMIYMTDIDEINTLSFYFSDLGKPVMGFVPTMVYSILSEGLTYISRITGLACLF